MIWRSPIYILPQVSESNMRRILEQVKKFVSEIEAEKQGGELPEWVKGELQIVRSRLSSLIS